MKTLACLLLLPLLLVPAAGCSSKRQAMAASAMPVAAKEMVAAREMLAAHNRWRAKVGVGNLKWSPALAAKAAAWAGELRDRNGCRMRHSGPGENLYWASASITRTSTNGRDLREERRVQPVDARKVVDSWGSEERWYSYKSNSCAAPAGKSCGHYTQLVWRDTTEVGCAMAVCSDDSQVWVCNYAPAGNIIGRRPY